MRSSPSPRKTRSRSRLLSGSSDISRTNGSPKNALSSAHDAAISTIPVMKAASMQPLPGSPPSTEKRPRHKMTSLQLRRLEELYQANTHPSRDAKETLAREIGMSLKSVSIWFQNRRQDRKRKRKVSNTAPAYNSRTRISGQKNRASPSKRLRTPSPPRSVMISMAKATVTKGFLSRYCTPPAISVSSASPADDSVYPDTPPSMSTTRTSGTFLLPCSRSPSSSSETLGRNSPPTDLWKLMPPLSPQVSVQRSSTCPGTAVKLDPESDSSSGHIFSPFSSYVGNGLQAAPSAHSLMGMGRRKPNLEWACANSAARRKHGLYAYYPDEDDSGGESGGSGLEAAYGSSSWSDNSPLARRGRQAGTPPRLLLGSRRDIAIPREYHALFPPDVVLGASLLLSLKHSADVL